MEPAANGFLAANGTQLPSHHKEGGLEDILGVMGIANGTSSDGIDHAAMPLDEQGDNGLLAQGLEAIQNLPVGQFVGAAGGAARNRKRTMFSNGACGMGASVAWLPLPL